MRGAMFMEGCAEDPASPTSASAPSPVAPLPWQPDGGGFWVRAGQGSSGTREGARRGCTHPPSQGAWDPGPPAEGHSVKRVLCGAKVTGMEWVMDMERVMCRMKVTSRPGHAG